MKLDERLRRLDRAFGKAPAELPDLEEAAFERGSRATRKRRQIRRGLSVVATTILLIGALAMAMGRMVAPKADRVMTAQGGAMDAAPLPTDTDPSGEPAKPCTPEPTGPVESESAEERLSFILEPEPEEDASAEEALSGTLEPTEAALPEALTTPPLQEEEALDSEVSIVYALANGNYYHTDPTCSGMVNAVAWTEVSARVMGKQPCPLCAAAQAASETGDVPNGPLTLPPTPELSVNETYGFDSEPDTGMVYFTEGGTYYHGYSACSGMVGAGAYALEYAEAVDKRRCPVCQPVHPDHYDLFLAAFGSDLDELFPGCAYSYRRPGGDSSDVDTWMITDGKAEYAACDVESFLKSDGGDTAFVSDLGTYEDVIVFTLEADANSDLWRFLWAAADARTDDSFGKLAEKAANEALREVEIRGGDSASLDSIGAAVSSDGEIEAFAMCFSIAKQEVTVSACLTRGNEGYMAMIIVD